MARTRYRAEFLRVYVDRPRPLVVENVHHADPTDHEFVAVLLRRTDLPNLTVVVGTGTEPVEDPRGEPAVSLREVLETHTTAIQASPSTTSTSAACCVDASDDEDARTRLEFCLARV